MKLPSCDEIKPLPLFLNLQERDLNSVQNLLTIFNENKKNSSSINISEKCSDHIDFEDFKFENNKFPFE